MEILRTNTRSYEVHGNHSYQNSEARRYRATFRYLLDHAVGDRKSRKSPVGGCSKGCPGIAHRLLGITQIRISGETIATDPEKCDFYCRIPLADAEQGIVTRILLPSYQKDIAVFANVICAVSLRTIRSGYVLERAVYYGIVHKINCFCLNWNVGCQCCVLDRKEGIVSDGRLHELLVDHHVYIEIAVDLIDNSIIIPDTFFCVSV